MTLRRHEKADFARTLYDMSQLLESADDHQPRVRRVLELLQGLVPYDQCALLEARFGHDPGVELVPEPARDDRILLTASLLEIFGDLVDAETPPSVVGARMRGAHLAVPLIGLDEVTGLLFVRSSDVFYTEEHLRALSVVAAKLAAYLTTVRSRDELVELARERDEARATAEAANRVKDDLLALVSHELKTPLCSLLAWAHLLHAATDAVARDRAFAEIEKNVQAQTGLMDHILDVACIAAADERLSLRTVEPAGLIEAALHGLRREAERKAIRVESDLGAAAMRLVLDPDRIGRAVSILVASAIDFTPEGGQIDVRLERAAGCARIHVRSDRTVALGARALERLEGGLARVKDAVELHGGRVLVESGAPDSRSTFTVELPRADAPSAHAGGDAALDGVRVLLVDHDVGLRESFRLVLEGYGALVTTVASAPEALAAIEVMRPDVMLFGDLATKSDAVYELAREVATRTCAVPMASISAWRLTRGKHEVAGAFRMHLPKPLDIATLVGAVATLAAGPR